MKLSRLRNALLTALTVCGAIGSVSYAQSAEIDSLKRRLANHSADTSRVRTLNRLSRLCLEYKPDTTYRLAQQAFRLAQQLDDKPGQARSLDLMGCGLSSLGDYPKAIRFFQQSLQISRAINDKSATWKVLNNMALPYQEQKDYGRSARLLQESVHTYEQVHGNDASKDALVYATMYGNLGEAHLLLNQVDSADYYLKKALPLSEEEAGRPVLEHTLYVLGDLQVKRNNPTAALGYYRQGLVAARQNSSTILIADISLRIARLYQKMGTIDSSIVNARRALAASQSCAYLSGVQSASQLLTQLYEGRDNTQALRYYKVAVAAKDSLFSQEKVKQLLTLDFEEQQRQQEIEAAKTEYQNRLRTYGLSALVAVSLLIALLLLRTTQRQKRSNQLLSQQKEEINQQRSKAEEALERLQAAQTQLIHQEKMASLGELTAGIAHEIQNPLNFVNNFSEVSTELVEELREGPLHHLPEPEKAYADELLNDLTQNLQKVVHHGKRADTIVRGMLSHSRIATGSKQLTNLNALAEEYLKLAFHGLRAKDKDFNAELVTDFDPRVGKVNVVPQDLGRVLLNLYNNAFYAVRQKQEQISQVLAGDVEPDTGDYHPRLTVSTRRLDDHIEIQVRDNGTGMLVPVQQKIFQPFFTTKPTGEGTGLGLSLSYDIVTKGHGGTIRVDSQPGEYTAITIQIPG
ncbi:tetratricopeptide repeat protein [Spirosoma soli]|uniref:histidine kinase n=1 Tax=Spirosoma soli TaxID=1770529 RepID=A0ABW5MC19_9BACT